MKISKDEVRRMESEGYRKALIDCGMYSVPTHKVHKDKSKYSRKNKHKNKDY